MKALTFRLLVAPVLAVACGGVYSDFSGDPDSGQSSWARR